MAKTTVDEHAALIADLIAPALERPAEVVRLAHALGRVTARAVPSPVDLPLFRNSQMDGFAVRAADLPGTLPVVGSIAAAPGEPAVLAPGQAVRIMTGAPVPEGADAVVPVEDAVAGRCRRDAHRQDRPSPAGRRVRARAGVRPPRRRRAAACGHPTRAPPPRRARSRRRDQRRGAQPGVHRDHHDRRRAGRPRNRSGPGPDLRLQRRRARSAGRSRAALGSTHASASPTTGSRSSPRSTARPTRTSSSPPAASRWATTRSCASPSSRSAPR